MAKKLSLLGILLALSLVLSYIDSLISASIVLPGVKLGLANISVLLLIYTSGAKSAFLLSALRVLIASILFSGFTGLAMSAAGAVLSFVIMLICRKASCISVIGASIAGGISHNIGQLAAAGILSGAASLLSYLPLLMISGLICGLLTGITASSVLKNNYIRSSLENI